MLPLFHYKCTFLPISRYVNIICKPSDIHKSHLSEPKRVASLLMASCLAYLWMIYLGITVMADEHKRGLIDRTDRVDKSLFRLGKDWLTYSLVRGLPFEVSFYLPPSLLNSTVR